MSHYHDYEILKDTPKATIERCKIYGCGKKLVIKKGAQDRIDSKKYLEEHVRDFAQPGGRTGKIFDELYGEDKLTVHPPEE